MVNLMSKLTSGLIKVITNHYTIDEMFFQLIEDDFGLTMRK